MFYPDADIEYLPEVIQILSSRLKAKLDDDKIQIKETKKCLQIVYRDGKFGPIFYSIKQASIYINSLNESTYLGNK